VLVEKKKRILEKKYENFMKKVSFLLINCGKQSAVHYFFTALCRKIFAKHRLRTALSVSVPVMIKDVFGVING